MRRDILFHLVNGPEGDPCLYANFKYENRAILFDLGDLGTLSARSVLKVTHAFVSHTHIDHFIGFDEMLRYHLGRGRTLTLCGPPGFTGHVEAKLRGYCWNLVRNYPIDFRLDVYEAGEGALDAARFRCQACFAREPLAPLGSLEKNPVIHDEPALQVESALLEHDIPCLAFSLSEKQHISVDKVRLEGMGLQVGPWVRKLKEAVLLGAGDDTMIAALASDEGAPVERELPVGLLKERILRVSPGQKVVYVTDTAFTPENRSRILRLAAGADILFCEAVFSGQDSLRADQRRHLTAGQAGCLAREAGAKRLVIFHFSPKYHSRWDDLYKEAGEAFGEHVD